MVSQGWVSSGFSTEKKDILRVREDYYFGWEKYILQTFSPK
jgi:hypothetical protein